MEISFVVTVLAFVVTVAVPVATVVVVVVVSSYNLPEVQHKVLPRDPEPTVVSLQEVNLGAPGWIVV